MNQAICSKLRSMIFVIAMIGGVPFVLSPTFVAHAQAINSVAGYVTGQNRRPVPDLTVELLDDLGRSVARTRTNSSGYYEFQRVRAGNFTVRIFTLGTDYEEQEQSGEIVNIEVPTSSGNRRTTGSDRQYIDFQLRLRRGTVPAPAASLFAQDVPPEATRLYEKALSDLDAKRTEDGLQGLRASLEIFPRYYAALERLGTEYLFVGRAETIQAADLLLGMAVEINPRGFRSWYGLAYARHSLKNYPEAMKAVEKALEINPSSVDALFLYGRLLRSANRYSEAEKHLVKAKGLTVEVPAELHWELALLYGKNLEKYAEAARELKLYLKVNPNAPKAQQVQKLIAEFEAKAAKK